MEATIAPRTRPGPARLQGAQSRGRRRAAGRVEREVCQARVNRGRPGQTPSMAPQLSRPTQAEAPHGSSTAAPQRVGPRARCRREGCCRSPHPRGAGDAAREVATAGGEPDPGSKGRCQCEATSKPRPAAEKARAEVQQALSEANATPIVTVSSTVCATLLHQPGETGHGLFRRRNQ
jgi:hypothetical protein